MFPEAPELRLHSYRSKDRVALIQIERTWATQGADRKNMGNARRSSEDGPDQSKEHGRRRKAIKQASKAQIKVANERAKEVALDR